MAYANNEDAVPIVDCHPTGGRGPRIPGSHVASTQFDPQSMVYG